MGAFDDLNGLYEGGRKGLDLLNVGKVGSLLSTGKGFTKGAENFFNPLGGVLGAYDAAKGGYETAEAIDKGDLGEGLGGAHDVLTGAAGIFGNVPGPVGEVADAFGAGMTVGDMAAPYVFGSEEEDNKPHMEAIPEDGVFKPTCGNQYIDKAIDWL
jgi:hypothetical protein